MITLLLVRVPVITGRSGLCPPERVRVHVRARTCLYAHVGYYIYYYVSRETSI